jgi:hypothetical protein
MPPFRPHNRRNIKLNLDQSQIKGSFCDKMESTNNTQSIDKKILSRFYVNGRGHVSAPKYFFDLGSRAAVAQALSRLSSGISRNVPRIAVS